MIDLPKLQKLTGDKGKKKKKKRKHGYYSLIN